MKYPRIDKKELDSVNKKRFTHLYKTIKEGIAFDNVQNGLNLTKSDIDLLAWNTATCIISQPY